jgi:hypothetical protein
MFTTAGPLVPPPSEPFDDIRWFPNQRAEAFKLVIENRGMSDTIHGVTAALTTNDQRVEDSVYGGLNFGDIPPGGAKTSTNFLVFKYLSGYGPESTVDTPIVFTVNIAADGISLWTSVVHFSSSVTGISAPPEAMPLDYRLYHNYPNPFNPSTTIRYQLPWRSHVTLTIFNVLGQKVALLADEIMEAGSHTVVFDASALPSGFYFYRLTAGDYVQTRKMVLMQ